MLYARQTISQQQLLIPRNSEIWGFPLSFRVRSTVNREGITIWMINSPTNRGMYLAVDVAFGELPQKGEYEYVLKDSSGAIVDAGLLIVDGEEKITEKYEAIVAYEQYEN